MNTPKGWNKEGERLIMNLELADFNRAVAMLNSVADIAEGLNHHPDMAINSYNKLIISTTTHSASKLTEKDYKLAQEITDLLEYQRKKQDIERNGR